MRSCDQTSTKSEIAFRSDATFLYSGELPQQTNDGFLFGGGARRKGWVADSPATLHRRIRDGAAGIGQRDGAAAAVVRIRAGGNEAAHPEPIHDAFGGGGVEIDQGGELVLRARSHLAQFGERRELRLRQPLDDPRHEDRGMPLHRDTQQEADLIVEPILGCGGSPGARSHGYTDSRRRCAATSLARSAIGRCPCSWPFSRT